MHTHMNRPSSLWIGFCIAGPISLCLGSFLFIYYVRIVCITVYCNVVALQHGEVDLVRLKPDPFRTVLPSVL